jgi:chromate transporter
LDADAPPAPQTEKLTAWKLFVAFNAITLTAFGSLVAVGRHALVQKHKWLTDAEFAEMLAIGQILPGPNMVNLSAAFGDRHAGWHGSVACVAGLIAAPTAIAISLAALLYSVVQHPRLDAALAGMAAAAAGIVLATAYKLGRGSLKGRIGLVLCAAIFAAVAGLRLPLALVLVVALPISLWSYGVFRRSTS